MPVNKIAVVSGLKIGKLTVGERILPSDPKVIAAGTPDGYIRHGSLRECQCECGCICYVSEYILCRQQVKSCGCIRLEIRRRKFTEGASKQKLASVRQEIRTLRQKYMQARAKGDLKEETRLFDLIVAARNYEKSLTTEIK